MKSIIPWSIGIDAMNCTFVIASYEALECSGPLKSLVERVTVPSTGFDATLSLEKVWCTAWVASPIAS